MKDSIFNTSLDENKIILEQHRDAIFTGRKRYKIYTYVKSGISISKASIKNEKPIRGSEEKIIEKIHAIRFNKHNPYVITGGHFHQLYVRNLGIFYNALLDPRIPSSKNDWINRQSIVLKTLALDLEVFRLAGKEFTTITPVRNNIFTGLNIYTRPSDSLFGILYAFRALTDAAFIPSLFPTQRRSMKLHSLQTTTDAVRLLATYKQMLISLTAQYEQQILDKNTGLIKRNITLSSARDGIKRESSFYDNVIAWTTLRYAKKLGLYKTNEKYFSEWKQRIIDTYWNEKEGIFLDDLSEESQSLRLFSADCLIITSSGFLLPTDKDDSQYLHRIIRYIKKQELDKPFPIHYSTVDSPKRLYRTVKHFAPSYMGTSIWCHWGMEYIKLLILLSASNNNYLTDAKKHLETYRKNIEKYGGYPETYDMNGNILKTRFYRSVLHNGWVINYEQAKMLLDKSK